MNKLQDADTVKKFQERSTKDKQTNPTATGTVFWQWNVQRISQKTNEILHEMEQLNIDVAVLTETKKKRQGSESLEEHYQYIKDAIHQAAGLYKKNNIKRKPYWWDEEIEIDIEGK
ncbi:hypothetical protein ILUMI_18655 [Ignelater luminosus]|uniref:Uncharacterized protein n=1 Tax=Ignelater luminosus TaxID=2038154 RepID=A0A8K0G6N3_IGNLU|nr:hypothetical protein ILUMI_18655 [Ignelater luminosus]